MRLSCSYFFQFQFIEPEYDNYDISALARLLQFIMYCSLRYTKTGIGVGYEVHCPSTYCFSRT